MFLVSRSKSSTTPKIVLRDRGDRLMKEVTEEGVVFLEQPIEDKEIVVRPLSPAEADEHKRKLSKAQRDAALKARRDQLDGAERVLASAKESFAKAEATLKMAEDGVEAAKKALGEAEVALEPKGDSTKGKGKA